MTVRNWLLIVFSLASNYVEAATRLNYRSFSHHYGVAATHICAAISNNALCTFAKSTKTSVEKFNSCEQFFQTKDSGAKNLPVYSVIKTIDTAKRNSLSGTKLFEVAITAQGRVEDPKKNTCRGFYNFWRQGSK